MERFELRAFTENSCRKEIWRSPLETRGGQARSEERPIRLCEYNFTFERVKGSSIVRGSRNSGAGLLRLDDSCTLTDGENLIGFDASELFHFLRGGPFHFDQVNGLGLTQAEVQ